MNVTVIARPVAALALLFLVPVAGCASAAVPPTTAAAPTSAVQAEYSVVPDLVGRTGTQASQELSRGRFRDVRFAAGDAPMSAVVLAQHPAPGSRWERTEPVYLSLDTTPVSSAVPTPPVTPPTTVPPTTVAPAPPSNTWTYRVTGPARASITYSAEGGNISQESDAALPWSTTVESPGFPGVRFAYVSAQNSDSGTVSCEIVAPSGEVVSQNSSEGPYAIVTCQSS